MTDSDAPPEDPRRRIVHVQLDERTMVRRKPEVEHERAVAIFDLLEENSFDPAGFGADGPFNLHLSAEEGRLTFDIRTQDGIELNINDPPERIAGRQIIGIYHDAESISLSRTSTERA